MLIVIPARKNSKGLPYKNRTLLEFTINQIPHEMLEKTYVSTDDEYIKDKVRGVCKIHNRTETNSQDSTSTLSVMKEIVEDLSLTKDEIIVMLYLTYPERTFKEVEKIYNFFIDNKINSLLCKKEVKSNPFLCMFDLGDGKGKQIIQHDLYRRQDYPKCFEISHYLCIFKVSELEKLNQNMYNETTFFYSIDEKIDIDEQQDLERFKENVKN